MNREKELQIKIDEDIKNSTVKCEKNYACISNNNHTLCDIEYATDNDILFIKCKDEVCCNYRIAFGFSSYICSCPVRIEICSKYKH